jgi:hypothetical protein
MPCSWSLGWPAVLRRAAKCGLGSGAPVVASVSDADYQDGGRWRSATAQPARGVPAEEARRNAVMVAGRQRGQVGGRLPEVLYYCRRRPGAVCRDHLAQLLSPAHSWSSMWIRYGFAQSLWLACFCGPFLRFISEFGLDCRYCKRHWPYKRSMSPIEYGHLLTKNIDYLP